MKSPIAEQEICVTCGFCCDGTLFGKATLQVGEKETLPKKMEVYIKKENKEYFLLPCHYFNEKCTIYKHKHKPQVCSTYRCLLLKSMAKNELSQAEAYNIINNLKLSREDILNYSQKILETTNTTPFRQILHKLNEQYSKYEGMEYIDQDLEILISKCFFLETQLIKHFKSKSDFDEMINTYNEVVKKTNIEKKE